jgi:SulP family sulfate permease
MELVAQGIANIGSAIFGGICATGTVARTATNVRSGARSPLAGIFHALFVVLFMVVAAPLASYIPLAGLAGVLAVVSWNMAEKQAFATLVRSSWGDAVVVVATFGLTVFVGLTPAIVVGFALGALLFLHRMAQAANVEAHIPPVPEDEADDLSRPHYDATMAADPDVAVYRITGAFFFGAAAMVGNVLDRIADRHKAFVIDFSAVPFIDSTAANTINGIASKAKKSGVLLFVSGASAETARTLSAHGVQVPDVRFATSLDEAVIAAHAAIGGQPAS